jgi:hypothetical protein
VVGTGGEVVGSGLAPGVARCRRRDQAKRCSDVWATFGPRITGATSPNGWAVLCRLERGRLSRVADCTLGELIRIERKFKQDGWDALDHDERVCLEEFYANVAPLIQHHEISHPEFIEGYQMWKAMPPEEREKYLEWKPREIYAWKLLIDEFKEHEEEA